MSGSMIRMGNQIEGPQAMAQWQQGEPTWITCKGMKNGFPQCLLHQSKHTVAKSSWTFQSTDVVFVIFNVCHPNICCCCAHLALLASLCDSYQKCVIISYYCFIPFSEFFIMDFYYSQPIFLPELVMFWIFLCSGSIVTLISFLFSFCLWSKQGVWQEASLVNPFPGLQLRHTCH